MRKILRANEARVRAEFAELIAIDAVSLHEREMADCLAGKLRELGFDAEEDDAAAELGGNAGNLFARLKGDLPGPPILLSGHMDTVQPGVGKKAVFHPDGTVTSDGTTVLGGDDMTGVAAILEGIRITREAGLPHRDLEVVFTSAEELYCRGSALFDCSRLRAKAGFVLDVSGPVGTAVLRAPSIVSFQVEIRGRAAHAGFEPEKGVHAIQIMSRGIAGLQMGRLDPDTTLNIGLISGGSVTNAVPELCTVQGEIRSYDHDKAVAALKTVEETFKAATRDTGAAAKIDFNVNFRAFHLSEDETAVRCFDDACRALGKTPAHAETFGGSDANSFSNLGIPTAVLSCGMYNCHTVSEYARIPDILDGAALISLIIRTEEN
jgi:tripeptide aminopeptidase